MPKYHAKKLKTNIENLLLAAFLLEIGDALFDLGDLANASLVSATFELSSQPGFDHAFDRSFTQHIAREA